MLCGATHSFFFFFFFKECFGFCSLGMREKLVERMLVILQAGHRHQEAFDHLPSLTSVVGLRVGTL